MAESSSVTRAIDPVGEEIGAIRIGNTFYQAVSLVDENGNQVGLSGSPLNVSITGDSNSVGTSGNPFYITLTASSDSVQTDQPTGKVNIANDTTNELLSKILLELRLMNFMFKDMTNNNSLTTDDIDKDDEF